jgi:hypothetical protein
MTTTDANKYADAWGEIGAGLVRFLNRVDPPTSGIKEELTYKGHERKPWSERWEVFGYDPGVVVHRKRVDILSNTYASTPLLTFPAKLAIAIAKEEYRLFDTQGIVA